MIYPFLCIFSDVQAMEKFNFVGYEKEWWHFTHKTSKALPILNLDFSEVLSSGENPWPTHPRWKRTRMKLLFTSLAILLSAVAIQLGPKNSTMS